MEFDPKNNINKLCAQGMQLEGEGKMQQAGQIFLQAWNEAITDLEKFTAAHYVARTESTIAGKLQWDKIALQLARNVDGDDIKAAYPSLYLNIAKGYEDLKDLEQAKQHYLSALRFVPHLKDDGYGKMIIAGINNGLTRIGALTEENK